jgi:serine protease Do
MVVVRDGKRVTLAVTVREQPANYGVRTRDDKDAPQVEEGAKFDKFGLEVAPLGKDVAQQLDLASTSGVVITAVESGSPADEAGLEAGMAVVQVARQPVTSVAEFEAAISRASPEKGVLLLVRSTEGSRFVVLKGK